MSWYTDTTNCPKIMMEGQSYSQPLFFVVGNPGTSMSNYHRDVAIKTYEFRPLTYAAADSISARYHGHTEDSLGVHDTDSTWFRVNEAGAYGVRVTEADYGPWAMDT